MEGKRFDLNDREKEQLQLIMGLTDDEVIKNEFHWRIAYHSYSVIIAIKKQIDKNR